MASLSLLLIKLLLLILPISDDSAHFDCKHHGNRVCDAQSAQQVTQCLKSNGKAITIDGKFVGCVSTVPMTTQTTN